MSSRVQSTQENYGHERVVAFKLKTRKHLGKDWEKVLSFSTNFLPFSLRTPFQFEDAVDALEAVQLNDCQNGCDDGGQESPVQTLEQALEEIQQVLSGALDNQFQEALKIAQKR